MAKALPLKWRKLLIVSILLVAQVIKKPDSENPNFQAINLPEVPYTSLNARTVQTFDAADGGFVTVEQLYVTVDHGASNATQAYTFMKYDKDGNFYDASAGAIYFLTQQRLGKGLSLYWHKL